MKHSKYARIFGATSNVLERYPKSFLKDLAIKVIDRIPDLPSFITASHYEFQHGSIT